MMHEVKIYKSYADAVLSGDKTFEVRLNDRGYQKGDILKFIVKEDNSMYEIMSHDLYEKEYEIMYVHSGLGLKENYVVMSIKPVEEGVNNYSDGLDDMYQCFRTILHFARREHREIFGDRWVNDSLINTIEEMTTEEFQKCVNEWVKKNKEESESIKEKIANAFSDADVDCQNCFYASWREGSPTIGCYNEDGIHLSREINEKDSKKEAENCDNFRWSDHYKNKYM